MQQDFARCLELSGAAAESNKRGGMHDVVAVKYEEWPSHDRFFACLARGRKRSRLLSRMPTREMVTCLKRVHLLSLTLDRPRGYALNEVRASCNASMSAVVL